MMDIMLTTAAAATADTSGLIFQVPIVGLLMVFVVLSLIWAVLSVSKVVFYDLPRKRVAQGETAKPMPNAPVVSHVAPTPAPTPATDDAAIVAAITAAIAAMRADEGCQSGFRVVSFRRADTGRAWNRK